MKANHLGLALWTISGAVAAAQAAITVRVYDYAGVAEDVLEKATAEGRRVLLGAGIDVEWINCPLREAQIGPQYQACMKPMHWADIILRIVPRTMQVEQGLERSLGYAMPLVGAPPTRAYVLFDRVRERVRSVEGISAFRLLACVMSHEIAHLLFGDDKHSRQGIMMAFWREKELAQIERGGMTFTPEEGAALRAGAIARVKNDQ